MVEPSQKIYIVVSQSGSYISKLLRLVTGAEYNHISISPYSDLHEMYSFGRRFAYYPFWSGFVAESRERGTFKRFEQTRVVVLSADITQPDYIGLLKLLDSMRKKRIFYGYNYLGACLSKFKIHCSFKNRYYCSEFVRELLKSFNVNGADRLSATAHPASFLLVPEFECIYKGNFNNYKTIK